jgi:hypothetical protein
MRAIYARPITSLTFRAGEPGWSIALDRCCSAMGYWLTLFLWWASGSAEVALMGLAASVSLTPLPPLYALRWLYRKIMSA